MIVQYQNIIPQDLNESSHLTRFYICLCNYHTSYHYKQSFKSHCTFHDMQVCELFQNWVKWRTNELEEDMKFCHPRWPEEKVFLLSEKKALEDQSPKYFSDSW